MRDFISTSFKLLCEEDFVAVNVAFETFLSGSEQIVNHLQ